MKSQKGDIISHPSSCVAVPAVAPLVRHEEGVLRDPVDGVEGGEDEREGGHAHKVQQLYPPLQPLRLKLNKVIKHGTFEREYLFNQSSECLKTSKL